MSENLVEKSKSTCINGNDDHCFNNCGDCNIFEPLGDPITSITEGVKIKIALKREKVEISQNPEGCENYGEKFPVNCSGECSDCEYFEIPRLGQYGVAC